jgi:proliferating cell nuclear antigen
VDETQFTATPDKLEINAMDPGRVCMMRLTIKKEHFDEYKCQKETKVGVNLEDLNKILKRGSAEDSVELDFNVKEQKIRVKLKRDTTTRTRSFSLAAITTQIAEVPVNSLLEIHYDSTWDIEPQFLIDAVKDAEIYSDALTIETEQGKLLKFSSIGQIGEMNYEVELSELPDHSVRGKNSGTFSLVFLKSILKISSVTERLEMALKTDYPLRLKVDLIEGGVLQYYLAPRSEEPDEAEPEPEEIEEIQDALEEVEQEE